MLNIINLRQTCSLPSKGRVGVGSFKLYSRSLSSLDFFSISLLPVRTGNIKTDNIGKSTFSVFQVTPPRPSPWRGGGKSTRKHAFFIQQLKKLTIIDAKLYQFSTNLLLPLQGEGWGGVI